MASLGRVGGSEELFLGYPRRSLRATFAHTLMPGDLSKHKTLHSSFCCSERHTEMGGKEVGMKEKVG